MVSADLQAANLATDQKFKALEVKVDETQKQLALVLAQSDDQK